MRKAPSLSAAQQLYYLRRNPVSIGTGAARLGSLIWTMEVTPTPASRTYTVRIELDISGSPQVIVVSPDLPSLAKGRHLPHVYCDAPVRLCLYHPRRREWSAVMRLDETIVPWTYLWLYYFERWLATDEWGGGGEHPEPDMTPVRRPRRLPRLMQSGSASPFSSQGSREAAY